LNAEGSDEWGKAVDMGYAAIEKTWASDKEDKE